MRYDQFNLNQPIRQTNSPKLEPSLWSISNQLDSITTTLQYLSNQLSALETQVSHLQNGRHFDGGDNNIVIDPKKRSLIADLPPYDNRFR